MTFLCFSEEIEAFWKAIAEISVNCILLVMDGSKFVADEVKMVKFVCQNLFEDSLSDRVLLVITKRGQELIDNQFRACNWQEQNSSDDTPFSKYPINSKITRGLNFFFLPKIAGYFRVRIIFECGLNSFFFPLTRNKCLFVDQKEFIMVIFCCN